MTPPALLALGAGSLVCALTASASVFGWPRELRRPRADIWRGLTPAEAARLLAMVPPGALVRLETVDEAEAQSFARAALALFLAEGRRVEDHGVFTVRGVSGSDVLHFVADGRHGLLVMQRPAPDWAG